MTSAFEQAIADAAAQQAAPQYNQPQSYTPPPADSQLGEAYSGEGESSQLFGGNFLPPSLLNKTNKTVGSERHGRIVKAPYDTHSRDFNSKQPKYWAKSPVTGANGQPSKITTNPRDHITGEALRPVLDTVIELQTDYRFDANEAAAVKRDPNLPDDGMRALYVSGDDLKQLKAEIRRIGGITKDGDLVGLTLSVTLVGLKPTTGEPARVNKITLSR